ncbi:hypothetical protein EMCRGX_G033735 [Ephydatia muelleri]|eukprot:Em0022g480a
MQNLGPRTPESQRVPTTSEMDGDISGEDFYDGLSVSKSAGLSQPLNTHLTVAPTLKTNIAANLLFRNNYIYYTGGRLRNQAPRSTDDVAKFYYIQLDTPFRFKLQSKGAPPDTSTLAANFSENAQQPTLVFTNLNLEVKPNLFVQRFYLDSLQASKTNILVESPIDGSVFYWSVDSTGYVILQTIEPLPQFQFTELI